MSFMDQFFEGIKIGKGGGKGNAKMFPADLRRSNTQIYADQKPRCIISEYLRAFDLRRSHVTASARRVPCIQ